MKVRKATPEYRAALVAGSQRLSGIHVSVEDENKMVQIIKGECDVKALIRAAVAKHSRK